MSDGRDWHIFGPAAICVGLGRPLPPVADVAVTSCRPDRQILLGMLGAGEDLQIRYVTEQPEAVVDLECIALEPSGDSLKVVDQCNVLKTRKIRLLRSSHTLLESLRMKYLVSFFPEFYWPEHLLRKLDSDLAYAKVAGAEDQGILLALMNLAHDFGKVDA